MDLLNKKEGGIMNIVKGMKFKAVFPVFSGSYRNAKYIKDVKIEGEIIEDCCYSSDSKHWLYFVVTASDDEQYYKIGKKHKKQGKNIYTQIKSYEYPENHKEVAENKQNYKEYLRQTEGILKGGRT